MVRNLPKNSSIDEVQDYFEDLAKVKVVKINFAYKINKYKSLFNKKIKISKLIAKNHENQEKLNELKKINKELDADMNNFEDDCLKKEKSENFSGTAFVSFQNQMVINF